MFNILLKPLASSKGIGDEVDRYLATDTEEVTNPLLWWWERRSMYPCLSQMALDYLSIPSMSFIYISNILQYLTSFFKLHQLMWSVYLAAVD